MTVAPIAYNLDLTADRVRRIFQDHFAGKYAVEEPPALLRAARDFTVLENRFIGVSIKLEQDPYETKLVYSPILWGYPMILPPFGLANRLWAGLLHEIHDFIDSAPEFRQPGLPSEPETAHPRPG